jgi:zinc transport system permease protein
METFFNPLYASLQSWVPFEWAQFAFMWRAVLATVVIAPLCAVMGVHVVNFRMAFFSDAISHSTFTGVALGILLGLDPLYSVVGLGALSGLFITHLRRRSELSSDTIISVILSGLVALGITLLFAKQETRNFEAYLYGALLALTDGELVLLFPAGAVIFILMACWFNRLILISLNMNLAASRGIAAGRMEYLFAFLLALVVTFSLRAVGLFLVTALLVIPAATARNLAGSIRSLFWIAVGVASFSGLAGILLSFYLDTPPGATIILIGCLLFLLSWIRQRLAG